MTLDPAEILARAAEALASLQKPAPSPTVPAEKGADAAPAPPAPAADSAEVSAAAPSPDGDDAVLSELRELVAGIRATKREAARSLALEQALEPFIPDQRLLLKPLLMPRMKDGADGKTVLTLKGSERELDASAVEDFIRDEIGVDPNKYRSTKGAGGSGEGPVVATVPGLSELEVLSRAADDQEFYRKHRDQAWRAWGKFGGGGG